MAASRRAGLVCQGGSGEEEGLKNPPPNPSWEGRGSQHCPQGGFVPGGLHRGSARCWWHPPGAAQAGGRLRAASCPGSAPRTWLTPQLCLQLLLLTAQSGLHHTAQGWPCQPPMCLCPKPRSPHPPPPTGRAPIPPPGRRRRRAETHLGAALPAPGRAGGDQCCDGVTARALAARGCFGVSRAPLRADGAACPASSRAGASAQPHGRPRGELPLPPAAGRGSGLAPFRLRLRPRAGGGCPLVAVVREGGHELRLAGWGAERWVSGAPAPQPWLVGDLLTEGLLLEVGALQAVFRCRPVGTRARGKLCLQPKHAAASHHPCTWPALPVPNLPTLLPGLISTPTPAHGAELPPSRGTVPTPQGTVPSRRAR